LAWRVGLPPSVSFNSFPDSSGECGECGASGELGFQFLSGFQQTTTSP